MVTLGVLGVLAVIAVPTYGYYTKKTQVTEAFRLMDEQRAKIEVIKKLKSCTASSGVPDSFVGKYGTLVVSGNYVPSSGPTCPTGCIATFTVNGVADKELQGKTVTAQILNNGSLSKVSGSTTIPDKYLPSLFTTQSSLNGDSCSALAGDATQTAGGSGLSGTTAADPVPVPPPPPPPPVPVPPPPPPVPVPPPPPPSLPLTNVGKYPYCAGLADPSGMMTVGMICNIKLLNGKTIVLVQYS